jgi:hypothetical protein
VQCECMEASLEELRGFFVTVLPHLNEVQRRVVAGAMATALGRGGKTVVAEASGLGRNTVTKGEREVAAGIEPSVRLRAPGAGDKPAIDKQPVCSKRSMSWCGPRPVGIRSLRCGGR